MRVRRVPQAVAATAAVALLVTACGSSSSSKGASATSGAAATSAAAAASSSGGAAATSAGTASAGAASGAAPASGAGFVPKLSGKNFGGKKITIWTSLDQPVIDGLSAKLDPEAKAEGINVVWSKVDNINQAIIAKVQANAAPDIATLPQPGIINGLATKGKVTALDSILDIPGLSKSMTAGTLDVSKVNGKVYGLMISMNVKGLVWYPKAAFTAAGYAAPTDLAGLDALTAKIKADGHTPWCVGLESGTATGWPATDWLENLVLKQSGLTVYGNWINHTVKFDSPEITKAATEFQNLTFPSGNTLGGQKSMTSNNFGTAGNPMFDAKPGCYMYMQGSFITGFFPKAVQKALDTQVGVFGLPPATAGGANPVEGGGDTASIYKDSPAAEEVMRLLSATSVGLTAAGNGSSFISPHKDFPLSAYPLKTTQTVAQVAYAATGFGFDASDAMPAAVGSGSFWKEMTNWVSGSENLQSALKNIDSSWPAS
ncbi:ABC transporter substrate-binding protein [Acidothermaceae bacterium B102]|nr:ABC transporter substrate-binding protein [Acidothermaceae bacterium B102]